MAEEWEGDPQYGGAVERSSSHRLRITASPTGSQFPWMLLLLGVAVLAAWVNRDSIISAIHAVVYGFALAVLALGVCWMIREAFGELRLSRMYDRPSQVRVAPVAAPVVETPAPPAPVSPGAITLVPYVADQQVPSQN